MVKDELSRLFRGIFTNIPGRLGVKLRQIFLNRLFKSCGKNLVIMPGTWFEHSWNIVLGDDIALNRNCWISGSAGITIGNDVIVGPQCIIVSEGHRFDKVGVPISKQGYISQKIVIGDRCWLGAQSVILPGTTIGDDVVIGAGSVVKGEIPPRTVVAGVPAKVIRER